MELEWYELVCGLIGGFWHRISSFGMVWLGFRV